jgi:hypothetical protein
MSARFFTDGRQPIDKTSAKGRLHAAVRASVEMLEQRQLLNAQVIPETGPFTPTGNAPLPPLPGVTTYVNGQGTSNAWQWNSAITPNTVNDLVLNVTAYAQSYTGCCEGTNNAPGNTGSINAGRLLTNGLTQNQVGGFPFGGAAPAIGSGSNSDASSGASVLSQTGGTWWLEYNLGTAPGQTPSSTGYDLNEIDLITGDQGPHTSLQADVLVQFVGSSDTTDWFSLSNYNNFNFTGLGGGSAQMAIRDPVGVMARNVRSVKFIAVNQQSYYRELVVTGTPSAAGENNFNLPPTPVPMVDPTTGAIDVSFGLPLGGAPAYQVQRALVTNGVTGAFSTIAGLVTTTNPMTDIDTTAATGSIYVYQIAKIVSDGAILSGISNPIATPAVGAEAHFYNMAYWEGPAVVNEGVADVQLNWPTGSPAAGIRNSVNSAAITGKVTPTESGTYTFYSNTDDDGYLYVNGVLVSSEVGLHSPENAGSRLDVNDNPIGFANPVQLTAGTSYNFVLLENNSSGGAAENLVWRTPDGVTEVVPSTLLTPISDPPTAPTNLTVAATNANFVNFTFTAENNAVVHYILQRAIAGTTNWTMVAQIDPGSDKFTRGNNLSTATPQLMTIQDAAPLPGSSYVYRVAALNFDGFVSTPAVQVNLTLELASAGLTVGTYFVAYTWAGDGSTVTGESSYVTINTTTQLPTSDEASVVVSGTSDIIVNGFPAAPAGVAGVNVYIGTSPGSERFVGSVAPTGSLVITSLPSALAKTLPPAMVNNTALVSGTVAANVPALGGANAPGVEIHAYNQELFRQTALPQTVEASAVAQNGLTAEYIAQTTNQSYNPDVFQGPIDRDYGALPPGSPTQAPSSPDPTHFPDIQRIHTESFSQAFTGVLTAGISGVYTIITNTDDDGYAWIDGTLVSADPGVHGQQDTLFPSPLYPNQPTRTQDTLVPVYLAAGQSYNLTMFMGNTGGDSGAHLTWVEPAPAGSSSGGTVATAGTSNTGPFGATVSLAGNSLVNQNNYENYTIYITSGPGAGQAGLIAWWNNTTKIATVNVTTNGNNLLWSTLPTSASQFMVAWVAPVPLQGQDRYPVSSLGGVQLHQDLPVEGTWSPADGSVSVTTSASAAQNVTITQVSPAAGVSLSWSDAGLSELWFEVQRSTDDTTWTTVGTTPMNVGTTFTDPGAANAFNSPTISYFYRIRGVNFDGAGPFSAVVNTKAISLDTITGTAGVDQITLTQDPDHLHIDWTINGVPQLYQESINSPNGLTINGNGSNDTIFLDDTNGNPLPNRLNLNGTFTIYGLVTTGTPLAGTTIDIGTSTVFINYAGPASDPISQFRSYLQIGFNGGAWNGTSAGGDITSSAAAANFVAGSATTGIGYADSADGLVPLPANTIELKYTLYGDTGLTGSVGFTDFMRMTQHFTQNSGATWDEGDFNYDGSVNSADFALLQPNYGQTLPAPAAIPAPIVTPPPTTSRPKRTPTIPPPAPAPLVSAQSTPTVSLEPIVADGPLKAKAHRSKRHTPTKRH